MTWYLKYRPQQINELDLVSVREHLGRILTKKDPPVGGQGLPHAWLFAGPRGTGKTSAARILAKTINADETVLDSADVLELDAASNRGIDEIRQLRQNAALAPMKAKYKVYLIDEVHMLTPEAFNALLKTLEEPPAHVVFILCTTEIEKLPPTVVSRCTVVKFSRPTTEEVVAKLEQVAQAEKLTVDRRQLTVLAQAAKGSFRDAIKILEQVALSGQTVDQVLGMVAAADPAEFVQLVQAGQTQAALAMIAQLVDHGGSIRGFIERCVEELRQQLLAGQPVLDLIAAFEQAYVRTKDAAVPRLPLEILVIERAKGLDLTRSTPPSGGEAGPEGQRRSNPVRGKPTGKLDDIQSKWLEILKEVRPKNHSVEALLRSTKPTAFDGQTLTLEVFYKFHKDKLETDKCRRIVEEAVGSVLGTDGVRLNLQLGQRTKREEVSAEAIEDDLVKAAAEIFKVEAI